MRLCLRWCCIGILYALVSPAISGKESIIPQGTKYSYIFTSRQNTVRWKILHQRFTLLFKTRESRKMIKFDWNPADVGLMLKIFKWMKVHRRLWLALKGLVNEAQNCDKQTNKQRERLGKGSNFFNFFSSLLLLRGGSAEMWKDY